MVPVVGNPCSGYSSIGKDVKEGWKHWVSLWKAGSNGKTGKEALSELQRKREGHLQKNAGKKVLGCFVSTLNIYHVPVTMLITLHALPLVFIIAFHVILCYVLFIKWVNWDSYSLIKFFNTLHQVKRTAKFQDYGCMVMKFIFSPALQRFSTLSAQ